MKCWQWLMVASATGLTLLGGWDGSLGNLAHAQHRSLDEQLRQPVTSSTLSQQRDIADQLLRLGRQQAAASQYEMAIQAWIRAADLYYQIGDALGLSDAYENMGIAYGKLGNYTEAEVAIRRQLAIARDEQDFENQIFAGNNLGTLQLQRGDVAAAVESFEDALTVAQSVQNYQGMGLSLTNLGVVAHLQGQYEDAIRYFETAGNNRSRVGDLLGQAHTNNDLGDSYRALGRQSSALGAYRLALSLGREVGDAPVQLHALDGLIDLYSQRSDWSLVRHYLDERISLTTDTQDVWQQLLTFQRLGEFYEVTNELASAQIAYQQALALAQRLELKPVEAELTNRLLSLENN